jgi:hypothetical protein
MNPNLIDRLKKKLKSKKDPTKTYMIMTTNPGDVHHSYFKEKFIDADCLFTDNPYIDPEKDKEKLDPVLYRRYCEGEWLDKYAHPCPFICNWFIIKDYDGKMIGFKQRINATPIIQAEFSTTWPIEHIYVPEQVLNGDLVCMQLMKPDSLLYGGMR